MIRNLIFLMAAMVTAAQAVAQDMPGVENCSAEKSWERRTGCLQANVNYLHALIAKNASESQQRLAAANAEIVALKLLVGQLQTGIEQLRAAAKASEEAAKKPANGKK